MTHIHRVQAAAAFASDAHSPHVTPFVSDRLTQGCVCVRVKLCQGAKAEVLISELELCESSLMTTSFTEQLTMTLP